MKSSETDHIQMAKKFMEEYPGIDILLKQGAEGSSYISHSDKSVISCPAVTDHKGLKIVDTTGAGDCFTAAFATQLIKGKSILDCMSFANKAAFLCIT